MKHLLLLLLPLLAGFYCNAQYFSTGQDPTGIHWRQIRTDHYRLVYPSPFEKKAQYLANILDIAVNSETHSLSAKVPRIPFLLHTKSSVSNGITVWAPKRIELYPCPPQDSYAEEWLEQLAIHEYRHTVQISKINQGFSKVLGYVFGEQITGGILGLYLPAWLLEGDAVVTETAMTRAGRGRSALFESTLKAQVVEKGIVSYDKATLGSYRTFTPDAYSLGYFLVGQARKKYGVELWNTAFDRVARYPFMVVPLNSGIHKVTGLWKTRLYKQALAELDSSWQQQLRETSFTRLRTITKRNPKNFTSYHHPLLLNDSTIIADKSSMDDIGRIVMIDRSGGREQILVTPGYHHTGMTSLGGNYLAWSALGWDPRWGNRDFVNIRLYDFTTGKTMYLTRRSRYFAPVISKDGSRLAAVHVSEGNRCSLDILEVPSGRLLRKYPIAGYGQAMMPNWSADATRIIFTLLTEKGETLSVLDTTSGTIRNLLPFSYNEFTGQPACYKQFILFSMSYAGVENVFAVDTLTRHIFRVASGRFATYQPSVSRDGSHIVLSDYTSDGLMVAETLAGPETWIPLAQIPAPDDSLGLFNTLAGQETTNIQDSIAIRNIYKLNTSDSSRLEKDSIRGRIHPSARYSKFLNLFNPHSWAPVSLDVSNLTINPGVMLLSQNILSTMFTSAGWEYDISGQTGRFYASMEYKGWYPVLTLRFDIGNRAGYGRYQGSSETFRFTWQETNFKAYVSIPWNFSGGRYSRYVQPSVGTTLILVNHNSSTPGKFTSGSIQTIDYRFTASQYHQSDQKDMFSRFGQSVDIAFRHTPFSTNDMGSVFGAKMNLYFPGILRHHGILFCSAYQQRREKDVMSYSFSNLISYPRGYTNAYDVELISLSANYKLPLWYPDFSFGSVIYLKRLKLNVFYDWAEGKNPGYVNKYQSTGCELSADFNLLRFVAPLEFGIRSLYYPGAASWGWEFFYAVALN